MLLKMEFLPETMDCLGGFVSDLCILGSEYNAGVVGCFTIKKNQILISNTSFIPGEQFFVLAWGL